MDWGDKGTPKAMSVAFRTFLLQALTIPTDEAEPDAQVYERDRGQTEPDPAPRLATGDSPASQGLQRTLAIKLGDFGLKTRADRLAFCSGMVARELVSSAELSTAEARQILETVQADMAEGKLYEPAPDAPDAG
jgi:hypothetical protein